MPVEELPEHGHAGTTDTTSLVGQLRSWIAPEYDGLKASGICSASKYGSAHIAGDSGKQGNGQVDINATHKHTITLSNTGSSMRHENRQPYSVIMRWKRTD